MPNGLYKNKYRVHSARRNGYDYTGDGIYFVTICTHEKEIFFGNVADGKMVLNEIGKLADKYWLEIPQHFENVILNEHVVMPNHVHGIVVIDNDITKRSPRQNLLVKNQCAVDDITKRSPKQNLQKQNQRAVIETPNWASLRWESRSLSVEKTGLNKNFGYPINLKNFTDMSETIVKKPNGKRKEWKSGALGTMINQYKRKCTSSMREIDRNFTWQTRFYDHIIRDKNAYDNIRQYIVSNPARWQRDRNMHMNLWM
jgi:putative transposase